MLNRCHFGDVLRILPRMKKRGLRANCIVTSIPYWAQRDYRIPSVIWGGDPKHAHVWTATGKVGGGGRKHTAGSVQNGKKQREQHELLQHASTGDVCECGAWRGQFGLERRFDCFGWATGAPCGQCYVCHVTMIFRLLWDVLAEDGTLWLNIGDCYSGGEAGNREQKNWGKHEYLDAPRVPRNGASVRSAGIKAKDILAQPWHIGLALRADGWTLRRPIIWHKKNCMPTSVKDRPTEDYEYVLLLSKTRHYFYDWVAIAEPTSANTHARAARGHAYITRPNSKAYAAGVPSGWDTRPGGHDEGIGRYGRIRANGDFQDATGGHDRAIRNKRSVWAIAAEPFHGKHYATFPRALVTPCILAGTSAHGHCPKCGAGWERITTKGNVIEEWKRACGADAAGGYNGKSTKDYAGSRAQDASATKARILDGMREILTLGWYPTCDCEGLEALPARPPRKRAAELPAWEAKCRELIAVATGRRVVPAVVLDPFAGSNTTGSQAHRLGRNWVAIEINPKDRRNQRMRFAQKERRERPARAPRGLTGVQLELAV